MHVPLTVHLKTARGTRNVTRYIEKLRFRKTAPGGHAEASFRLARPLSFLPDEISYYSDVSIIDGRNLNHVWDGRQEDPGREADLNGEGYDLTCGGGSTHASDDQRALVYVDRRLSDAWFESSFSEKFGNIAVATDEVVASVKIFVPRGTVVTAGNNDILDITYQEVREATMKLARVSFDWDAGVTDTNWRVKMHTRTDQGASPGAVISVGASTAGGSEAATVGATNFNNGHNVVNLRLDRDTSNITVANDSTWLVFRNIVVRAMLKDINGADITSGAEYTLNTVYAHEVVEDLIGRMLPKVDPVTSEIVINSYGIQQLAYPDGTDAREVLDDLVMIHPTHYWAILERQENGKYRMVWNQWPTTVRYECDLTDGYGSSSSGNELFNQVRVRYKDKNGRPRTVLRTQTVDDLTEAGLTRTAFIDLGDNAASLTNAQTIGDNFLAEHKSPPNAGRLRITKRILDRLTGKMVEPWEIEPGYLIRVKGIQPYENSLNATGPNAVTVFRIVEMEYDTDEAAAELSLDSFAPSVARTLAQLIRSRQGLGRTGQGVRIGGPPRRR